MISIKTSVVVTNLLMDYSPVHERYVQIHSGCTNTHPKLDTVQALYPKPIHNFGQNTLSYQGPNIWNSIPIEISRLGLLSNFIKKFKTILENIL